MKSTDVRLEEQATWGAGSGVRPRGTGHPSPLIARCARCKRTREGDRWISRAYLEGAGEESRFTHGFCPECLRTLYPEIAESVLQEVDAGRAGRGSR